MIYKSLIRVLFCALFTSFLTVNSVKAGHDEHGHDGCSHSHESEEQGFYGHLHSEMFLERSEFNNSESTKDAYTHSHLELGYDFANGFSISTNLKAEGASATHSHNHSVHAGDEVNKDGFFEDLTFMVQGLKLNYNVDNFNFYIGKFSPVVGFNYHSFPGIYGYQLAEDYALLEKNGVGASVDFYNKALGEQKFEVSLFSSDTTILSDSLVNSRHQTHKKDGGVGNNEDLSSYAISLGGQLSENSGLSYRFGHATQKETDDAENNERRYSASLAYDFDVTSKIGAEYLVEYMNINHLSGEANHDRVYLTNAVKFDYEKYDLAFSYALINNDAGEADENHDGHVFYTSAGYQFTPNVGFDVGYRESDIDNEKINNYTIALTYEYDFH